MKNEHMSPAANSIIEAGIAAGKAEGATDALSAADKAVEHAVGRIGVSDPANGDLKIIRSLIEIVQLHVRQQLTSKQA